MKYCEEMTNNICKSIKELKGRTGACDEVGITYDTFCHWMKKKEFSESIKEAEKEAGIRGKNKAIMSIFKHMKSQWTCAAWWLERNFPDQFVVKQRIESETKVKTERFIEVKHKIDDESLKALGQAIVRAKVSDRLS